MNKPDVKIEGFEGPLDLLLHLIEKNKYNIFDIPIVEITEQYLGYLEHMTEVEADLLSDFLVMASTLIAIKTRMLLPKEEKEEEDEDDPRAELVKSLIEYKMYKYAAIELKDMELDAGHVMFKKETIPKEVKQYREEVDPADLIRESNVTMAKLHELFQTLLRREADRVDPVRSRFGTITRDEIRLEDRMVEIRSEIRGLKSIRFRTLLTRKKGKMNLIVSFLAILELMKTGVIAIRQEERFGEIMIDSLEG